MKVELRDVGIVVLGAALGGILYMLAQPVLIAPLQAAITGVL